MAFSALTSQSASQVKSAASSWVWTHGSSISAGKLAILCIATDNLTTTDGNTNDHTTVTDSAGNTWTKLREFTNGQGGAASGATVSLWYSILTANIVGLTTNITMSFSGSITAKGAATMSASLTAAAIQIDGTGDLANDGADAGSITLSSLANVEHLFIRGGAIEDSTTTYTVSTSYTAQAQPAASTTAGGGAATNMAARLEARILTGTSDSTNPTTSAADQASTMVAISEVVAATVSDALPRRDRNMGALLQL